MILLCILCVQSAVYLSHTHYMQSRNCVLLCTFHVLTTCRVETVSHCVLAVYSLHAESKLCPTVYLLCNADSKQRRLSVQVLSFRHVTHDCCHVPSLHHVLGHVIAAA